MSKQVVPVTGALTGIGCATALNFAKANRTVVISGRHEDTGQALVTELREPGMDAAFVPAAVHREEDVASLIDQIVERFGRLDAAVNNADTEGRPGP